MPAPATEAPATPAPADDDVEAALEAGIAAAGTPATEAATTDEDDTDADEHETAGRGVDGGDAGAGADGDPAAAPADPADPAAAAAADPAADPAKAGEDAAAAAIEGEVKELGLKEKAAARFRELAADREAMAPVRAAMATHKITDPAELVHRLERVESADYLISRVVETGASAEQFDGLLNYATLINKAGDLDALEEAYALVLPEFQMLCKVLGKDVPGLVDPLEDHADLKAHVEAGDMPRELALQTIADRQRAAMVRTHQQSQRQAADTQREQEQAHAQAVTSARGELTALGNELQAADPARYAALGPQLIALVQQVAAQHPPHEWVARVARAYATLPTPAPAPAARAGVGHVPVRATSGRPELAPATFDDPDDALEFGINAASR